MKVLVCGGRDFRERKGLFDALDAIATIQPITLVIHGAAPGADTLAGEWAKERGVPVDPHPANWKRYGSAAGAIRNAEMLKAHPDIKFVVAFPGGSGTADMKRKARDAHFQILEPYGSSLIANAFHPAFTEDGTYSATVPPSTKDTPGAGALFVVRHGRLYGVRLVEIDDPLAAVGFFRDPRVRVKRVDDDEAESADVS